MIAEQHRISALERYELHREAWRNNEPLRTLYEDWYRRVAAQLPDPALGPFIEIGSGPGFARSFIPELQLSDVVGAPWHDHLISADQMPLADGSVGALVLFDVLHHLSAPATFFREADRVLVEGGRLVMCEPFVSPLSFPVYRWLHPEPLILGVDPFVDQAVTQAGRDPFDANQAIPTLIFARRKGQRRFQRQFPTLTVRSVERLAGLSHAASGGFGRAPLLPTSWWRVLNSLEKHLPTWAFHVMGFRILVVIEKRQAMTTP